MPAVVAASGPEVATRFIEFFLVAIRNPNTRRAYAAAVRASALGSSGTAPAT